MMFVGYPLNREEDSVRMWNRATNGVVTTRDVIYLKRMFYEIPNEKSEMIRILEESNEPDGTVDAVDEVPSADIEDDDDDADAEAGEDAVEC